jgi:hypothetical protein
VAPLTARCTAHAHRSPPHSPRTPAAVRSRDKLTFAASPAPSVYHLCGLACSVGLSSVLPSRAAASLARTLACWGKIQLWTRWSPTELADLPLLRPRHGPSAC